MKKTLLCLVMAVIAAAGAVSPAQNLLSTSNGAPAARNEPEIELFAGYSYWAPSASVNGFRYTAGDAGMIFSSAYYVNRYLGGQFEAERSQQDANDGMRAFSAGPIVRFPGLEGITPFAHALVGAAEVTGPNEPTIGGSSFYFNPEHWGAQIKFGGGLDYATPFLNQRLSLRLIQVDYEYAHVNFGPVEPTTGGSANLSSVRVSTGITYTLTAPGWLRRR
jgi:opacity protein-like surface antigen